MANKEFTLPHYFRKDFLRKLISLVFALLVWISVKNKIGIEQMLLGEIPVNFELPGDLIMSNESQSVRIKVRTSEKRLASLSPHDFRINIPVREQQYSEDEPLNIIVKATDVTAPYGVQVVGVEQARVIVHLDRIISKKVKVHPHFTGGQEGYATGKVTLIPAVITITGPRAILAEKERVNTEPIPLDHMTASFEFEPKISINNNIISTSDITVLAKVEILRSLDTVSFNSIPVRILSTPEVSQNFDIKLESEYVNVQISGSKSDVELVKYDQVKAYIDVSTLKGVGTYSVNIDSSVIDSPVAISNVAPMQIKVTLNKKK